MYKHSIININTELQERWLKLIIQLFRKQRSGGLQLEASPDKKFERPHPDQ
jgi:hypothetical protein